MTITRLPAFLLSCMAAVLTLTRVDAANPFLATNGLSIRNGVGAGDVVPLRGVNLGGWLVMEPWMVPMDSSGLADEYSMLQTLDARFGVPAEQGLIQTYQSTWITTQDLDNIKAMGMNVVRLPFWWANLQALDGTWRSDAFTEMDWLVAQAWQRGLYTILDFHGLPGGQSNSESTGQANRNLYWTSTDYQGQTVLLWQQVAAHYKGNPAVAGYDLINEPDDAPSANNYLAVLTAYNSLYQSIRAVDPNHIIFIEGTFGSWNWSMLPPPSTYGWTNVVYEMHEYQYASTTNPAGVETGTTNQITDFQNHTSWNVPAYIGEFNDFSPGSNPTSVWQDAVRRFDANNMSWSMWSYKAIHGTVGDSWGVYDPVGSVPAGPNIQMDPAATINNVWAQTATAGNYGLTTMLQRSLGAPMGTADFYTVATSGTLAPAKTAGILANDQDINLGASGIKLSAVFVDGPAHGKLTLSSTGTFTYVPTAGYTGSDVFRYNVSDAYVTSAGITTVSIQVGAPPPPTDLTALAADAAVTLSWTSASGAASYNLRRAAVSGGPYTTLVANVASTSASAPAKLTFTDTNVTDGTTYYYVVAAVNTVATGSNSAEVSAKPAQNFAQWIAAAFPGQTDPQVTDPDADPDGDGVPNLLEYVFGTKPSASDAAGMVTCTLDGQGNAVVKFHLAKNLSGVVYTVQQSADLVTWTDTGVAATILGDGGSYSLMQAVVPLGVNPTKFFRLSATLSATP